MNAVVMDMPLMNVSGKSSGQQQTKQQEGQGFQKLLSSQPNVEESPILEKSAEELSEVLQRLLQEVDVDQEEVSLDLKKLLQESLSSIFSSEELEHQGTVNNEKLEQLITKSGSSTGTLTENQIVTLDHLLTTLSGKKSEELFMPFFISMNQGPAVDKVDITDMKKSISDLMTKVDTILSQLKAKEDVARVAPKLLELLQEWSKLEKNAGKGNEEIIHSLKKEALKGQVVWKDLVQSFEKRDQLSGKQLYHADAKVTTRDVTKWMDKVFENNAVLERPPLQVHTGATMSKLEQYVIHLNQNQTSTSGGQQLINQFETIMKTSKFLSMPNGKNQLSITLQPNNLGEMHVRLIQMNGEMTVKIMVTTQAAKEMLESNMNQLKHMFSPQQVVIEKQEANTQQNQLLQKEQTNEQGKQDDEQQHSDQSDQDQNQHTDGDFESQFRELLMNEKV